ncbi:hypothetical protein VNO77_33863 [Canavalia gladiata]|uniref:Uncharacterized protein n=1 Tax=Canavalia gladiata TaxID=3824 RepID=A0AAN9KF15_CANGL
MTEHLEIAPYTWRFWLLLFTPILWAFLHLKLVNSLVNTCVIGGTINLYGALHVQVITVGSNVVLSRTGSLIEITQISKTLVQKFVDYIASIFVPIVVSVVLLMLLGCEAVKQAKKPTGDAVIAIGDEDGLNMIGIKKTALN